MGVHGLWELLAPVGRRVSVDTLAGKKLAIDASIWMIQFMKAMRDEKGEMVRNAHILGFFRRICKLLYLRTKPVFVFDGGTPALKRRTVIARRRQRENAQAKIRKTAEKLLLNQLKTMRLKELAADIEKQRRERDTKGKKRIIEEPRNEQETQKGNNGASIGYNQEELDEMLAASIAAVDTSTSGAPDYDELYEEDEDEEMILPEMHGKVDPAVLAALPPSMQLDLLVQMRERLMAENRQKYQKVKKVPARFSELQIESYLKTVAFRREIDGVQKSAAGKGIGGVQTSRIASEANREFIFSSSFTGDKQTLTSVGQGRREADQVEAPPINSSAMAPPVNSPAKAPLVNYPSKALTVNSPTTAVNVHLTKRSDATPGPNVSETAHDGVETYVDERGRIRVSRVRALGIRMTRDLQRNLDLMKEIDQQKLENNLEKINESASAGGRDGVTDNSSGRIQHQEAIDKTDGRMDYEIDEAEVPTFENGASIEISFEDTLERQGYDDNDDKLFARLVAGDNVTDFSVDNSEIVKEPLRSVSDNEWEDGIIEGKSMEHLHEERCSDEEEVEWEEGLQDIQLKMSSCPVESQKTVTKGAPEEETAFQEAIFRSLEDKMDDFKESYTSERAKDVSFEEEVEWEEGSQDIQLKSCLDKRAVSNGAMEEEAAFQEAIRRSLEDASGSMVGLHKIHPSVRAREIVNEKTNCISICVRKEHLDVETFTNDVRQPFGSMNDIDTNRSEEKSATSVRVNPDQGNLELKPVNLVAGESRASAGEMPAETCGEDDIVAMVNKLEGTCSGNASHDNGSSAFNDSNASSCYADAHMFHVESGDHFCDTEKVKETSADDSGTNVDGAKELTKDKVVGNFSREKDEVIMSNSKEQEIMEDRLEEEMLFLDKEREQLGSEQRKLERDAESVSNEMFAECQELLQMFGLPYIIAPMEAEAQCAFMELSNLVDGVVTDDSDAFLFGAQSVYKNIFDDRKYVETYLMKDIESEIGLDREKLIRMALLLGSDYTEGISGIGIVNAIEVVNAFPGKDGLREFREWIESPDPSILGKLHVEKGGNSRKKGLKVTENIMSDSNSNVEGTSCDQPQAVDDDAIRKRQTFMDKHRNVSKNWHISTSFPSDAVISAYASPQVDKSLEPFSWGKPDLFVLRKLCWEKFGWGAPKADELLVPVLKEYNKHETQLRLEAFYTFNENFAKIRSKRIEKAVRGITGPKSSALIDKTSQQSVSGRKRKAKPCEDEANQSKVDSIDNSSQNNTTRKPTVKGRQRGRGRGQQGGGRGRRKTNSFGIDAQISKDDDSISENDKEMQQVSEDVHQVRRSGRARKSVDYTVSDESHNSENKDETYFKEALMDQEVSEIDKHNKNQLSEGGDVVMRGEISVEETEGIPHGVINKDKSVVDDDQMDDPSDHGQSSKEYLQFGGGFCLDEDEEKECSREMVGEKGDLLDNEVNMNDKSSLSDPAHSSLDDAEDDPGNSNRVYFRAIPNLRRKKSRR